MTPLHGLLLSVGSRFLIAKMRRHKAMVRNTRSRGNSFDVTSNSPALNRRYEITRPEKELLKAIQTRQSLGNIIFMLLGITKHDL